MPAMDISLSDEEYIIMRAKQAQKSNVYAAKAWMLTAKTLFPSNFNVQFEAYLMEKSSGHVKEAAESFSALVNSTPIPPDLWPELDAIMESLKNSDTSFLCQMFEYIPADIQHQVLLATANHTDNLMEHCRLLLLLLKKFPQSVPSHGGRLVETLLSAEKHSSGNRYARLLVVDTLPLLGMPQSPRLLQRLLVKAIDFYNTYVHEGVENDIPDPWQRLYAILELLGKQLGWDPYLINYTNSLNKEMYFQKLLTLRNIEDCRELLYCGTIFLLRSLHEQRAARGNHILLEAFTDSDIPMSMRRKGDTEVTGVTAHQFQAAAKCWELLHCNEILSREFMKLTNHLQAKPWLGSFTEELSLYRGRYDEAVPAPTVINLAASLIRASVSYCQSQYSVCLEHILCALTQLPAAEGVLDPELIAPGTNRHLHFLPLTKLGVVHYCCCLLIRALGASGGGTDLALGHIMVLMQLGWPQDEAIFLSILEAIKQNGVFHYPLFQSYIIHIDILEELMFLWCEQGGNIELDILPNAQQHLGQRRIGTRGADKGVKEDFKQAMKAQVARSNESILNLVIQFITQERIHLIQSFIA